MIRRGRGKLQAKERLVLSMIDYFKVVDETPEENILTKKAKDILVMAYEYLRDTAPEDYPIILADELKIPEDDFPQLLADWQTVVQKVRDGKAHEISSSDTLYLEACTKAANSRVRREQPFGEPAKPRAWAFKRAYIDVLLNGILDAQQIIRDESEKQLPLLELVQKRFAPHLGKTQSELAFELGVRKLQKRPPKNECALITKKILGVSKESEIAEFVKAGIKPKTIRVKRNGTPKEAISFPTFDPLEVADVAFEDSEFYSQLQQKYLFVVFREDATEQDVYRLREVVFWQMPDEDVVEAARCFRLMAERLQTFGAEKTVGQSENRCCHVRPHGRNKQDTVITPTGEEMTKKSFWLNQRYIKAELRRILSQ